MKKINKLFLSFILTALCLCSIIPFAACGEPQWQEVQSVSYTTESGETVLNSEYSWNMTSEKIDENEYLAHSDKLGALIFDFKKNKIIPLNRNELFSNINLMVGATFYSAGYYPNGDYIYEKFTLNSYELNYVKVKITGKTIEIGYNDRIEELTPISYEITYFEN